MKKRILLILTIISLIFPITVSAASGSVKASVSSTKVTLNNTFNVTVKVSSDVPLGSWQFNIEYDSSKLNLVSGDPRIVGYGDGTFNTKSYTYRFKSVGLGSATVSVTNAKIADYDTVSYINTATGGVTVSISEPVQIIYSSDNNLTSLNVENYELSPEFNKNTLEYSVITAPGTTSVSIKAKASHSKAKISGTGVIDIVEGDNILPVVVTAENGAKKTYNIKVTVPEKEPVKIEDYSILRKLPEEKPEYFTEQKITINEEEIAALHNEKLDFTLVYAKYKEENPIYYEFKNNQIKDKFISIKSGLLTIRLIESDKLPLKELKKETIKLNNHDYNAYKLYDKSNFWIVYGTDLITGKSNFYSYDSTNNTLQIFDTKPYEDLYNRLNDRTLIIYALGSAIVILILITILLGKNKSKIKKIETKLETKKSKK